MPTIYVSVYTTSKKNNLQLLKRKIDLVLVQSSLQVFSSESKWCNFLNLYFKLLLRVLTKYRYIYWLIVGGTTLEFSLKSCRFPGLKVGISVGLSLPFSLDNNRDPGRVYTSAENNNSTRVIVM